MRFPDTTCGSAKCDDLKKKNVMDGVNKELETGNEVGDMSKDKMKALGLGCCNQ